ncbi:M14 family zinc carboxypeptidase [Shewanella sp. 10N.286.54.B9]|uniref:M14 family zinc carboxypeptidase n=1 Tax=Shewanella sp. 10N.286.54.B9 TaxID=3229719 RepID=UPI003552E19B
METLPTELHTLVDLIDRYPQLHARTLTKLEFKNHSYPVISAELGAKEADVPCVLFVGGVHGVEVIGIQVIMALLESILSRLEWDSQLQLLLSQIKLAFVPIVNPVGLQNGTRCNGQRVDLMRNAPIEAETKVTFLVGGQKLSSHLPWYRGRHGVEQETQALIQYVEQLKANASSLISLDAHSGFGMTDHIWFPFAGSNKPMQNIGRIHYLEQLYQASYPHHSHYSFSPQSLIYRTHGDIWDYLTMPKTDKPFLPLTLEMGSWIWVKKNPRQVFNFAGFFNPQKQHRQLRALRKHTVLMHFLMDLAASRALESMSQEMLIKQNHVAFKRWFQR